MRRESFSPAKALCILGIVAAVIGLKLVPARAAGPSAPPEPPLLDDPAR